MSGRGRVERAGRLALVVMLTSAGCQGEGDDGVADDSAGLGSGEDGPGADGGSPMGAPLIPDGPYCDPVAAWSLARSEFEDEVVALVNAERAAGASCGGEAFGATSPLAMEPALRCAARVHSLDMAERQFFDHQNPDGEDPFVRMERAGYRFSTAGENIAAGQSSPEQVVQGWMESTGHCRNIMNPDFTEIGVGYVLDEQSDFPHYWTQTFGRPR